MIAVKANAGVSEFTMFQDAYITLQDQLAVLSSFDNATMSSESQKLLHEHPSDSDSEPELERKPSPGHLSPSPSSSRATSTSPALPGSRPIGFSQKRQSSFARARPDGAPRTPNRVRFHDAPIRGSNGDRDWIELESDDYMSANGHDGGGIEAPSVTVAEDFDPEDYLESARPRSGMKSAFMNMANSIMCDRPLWMREACSANVA
jgi:sodium-coupled neutral amino acid transporter 11